VISAVRSSRPTAGGLGPQVEDQGTADQTESEARRDQRNQHSGREDRQDNEGSAPRQASRTLGHLRGVRTGQYCVLEGVVGNVDASRCTVSFSSGIARSLSPSKVSGANGMKISHTPSIGERKDTESDHTDNRRGRVTVRSSAGYYKSEEFLHLGFEPVRSIVTILQTGPELARQLRLTAVAILGDIDGNGSGLGPFLTTFKDNGIACRRRGNQLESPGVDELLGVSPSVLIDEAANSFIRFPKVQASPDDSRIALQHDG
jgi:hypothetical protein